MVRKIGYTLAGAVGGWLAGAIVLVIIDPKDPRLLLILYAGAVIGAITGFRYTIFTMPKKLVLSVDQAKHARRDAFGDRISYGIKWGVVGWIVFAFLYLGYNRGPEGLTIGFSLFIFSVIAGVAIWVDATRNPLPSIPAEDIYKDEKNDYWADNAEIKEALQADKYPSKLNVGSGFLWSDQGNILTVGGARGGKGTCIILPALLDYRLADQAAPSFVVLDPKGENCAVSAPYLKRIGYKVHVINPFGIPEIAQFGKARINPFDMFNIYTPDFGKYLDMIAFALIPVSNKQDSTWDNAGRKLIKFYIAHMMTVSDEPKNFVTLYNWMHYAGEKRDALLNEMSKNTAGDGVVAAGAWSIIGHLGDDAGKMVAGMYEAAQAALAVFDDSQLRQTISGSDFNLSNLTAEKTAIFICVNPSDLRRVQTWMRIIFNTILDGLPNYYNANRKVVMLMDEFPTIGRLQAFENNFAFLPGYNVTLWPVVQDLVQLEKLYPDIWQSFVGQAQIKHWLAVDDNFTADYVSARTPKVQDFRNPNEKSGQLKYLLEPYEVRQFKGILTEIKGLNKLVALEKAPYWVQTQNGAENPFRN